MGYDSAEDGSPEMAEMEIFTWILNKATQLLGNIGRRRAEDVTLGELQAMYDSAEDGAPEMAESIISWLIEKATQLFGGRRRAEDVTLGELQAMYDSAEDGAPE